MQSRGLLRGSDWQAMGPERLVSGLLLLGLLGTWFWLFLWIAVMTEASLVPWDIMPGRPPVGTWQRAVNDFFGALPGAYLPSGITVAASAGIFYARSLRLAWLERILLIWAFAVTNIGFILIQGALWVVIGRLVGYRLPTPPGGDAGYHRTWPDIVVALLLLVLLLMVQARIRVGHRRGTSSPL